jgi:hypothetical protein
MKLRRPEAWLVIIITNIILLILALTIPLPLMDLKVDLVDNLLGGNLTLSGTLLAFIGISITTLSKLGQVEKRTIVILSTSVLIVMTISTTIVFLCFYWHLDTTSQPEVGVMIVRLFFLLPIATVITGIETVLYLLAKIS